MFKTLAALALAALAGCAVAPVGPAPGPGKAPCTGDVTVDYDEPTPCDLIAPQRLTLTGATLAECNHAGGRFVAPSTCVDADY